MTDVELLALNSMLIGIIAICVLIFIIYNKIEFSIYVPGLVCIISVFILDVFENEVNEEILDFLENALFLSGVILLLIAALLEYHELKRKNKNNG